jgi:flagellar biosynthesis chaperone FliJ
MEFKRISEKINKVYKKSSKMNYNEFIDVTENTVEQVKEVKIFETRSKKIRDAF